MVDGTSLTLSKGDQRKGKGFFCFLNREELLKHSLVSCKKSQYKNVVFKDKLVFSA